MNSINSIGTARFHSGVGAVAGDCAKLRHDAMNSAACLLRPSVCVLGGHPEVRALSLAGAAEPRAAGAVRPHPTGHGGPRTARQHRARAARGERGVRRVRGRGYKGLWSRRR